MAIQYKDPAGGTASTIGSQINTDYYNRKALMDVAKTSVFQKLADVTTMPKHYGKEIKVYQYFPLLDDRNVNDQGIDAAGATIANGNLYGSSKDIGTITAKIPALNENGGRVNRVTTSRQEVTGSIANLGFFHEYTEDSMQFDSDPELQEHMRREILGGANEITEDVLQADLLNGAGTVYYAGAATTDAEVSGETGATPALVDYNDFQRLSVILDDNKTPTQTKMITGSSMVDSLTVRSGRVMYIGTSLEIQVRNMTNDAGKEVFIGVEQYGAAMSSIMPGEIGTVAGFHIVVVPEMEHWAGAGGAVTNNDGYAETDNKYDIHPMLVVGAGSFTTIGFQTGGKSFKFKIIQKKYGEENADLNDPYGKTGFFSIQWWYGTMILRPERLAVIKTLAEA